MINSLARRFRPFSVVAPGRSIRCGCSNIEVIDFFVHLGELRAGRGLLWTAALHVRAAEARRGAVADPAKPRIRASLPLMNSLLGPPTNLQITPDGKLGLVANSVVHVQEGNSPRTVCD
jgi:hypothetical protein